MRPALIIFDCDGVLVDSEPIASTVLSQCLKEVGLFWDPEEVDRRFRGRSLRDCLGEVEDAVGHALGASFLENLNHRTYRAFEAELSSVEGVCAVLEELKRESQPMCVASSGSLEKMHLTLGITGLLEYFSDVLFSAAQVARGKPAPDLFLHAADEMGYPIENAWVIEDSLPGVLGAKAAGARVLGFVAEQSKDSAERMRAMSDLNVQIFARMSELPALLRAC